MFESAEAQLESFVHVEAGVISRDLIAIGSAEKLVNGLTGMLAANIPQGEIDAAQRHDRHALASVKERGVVHLLPDCFHVQRVGSSD